MSAKVISPSGLATSANPLSGGGGSYALENMLADIRGWATRRNGMKLLAPTVANWNSVFSLSSSYSIVSCWYFDDHIWIYVEDTPKSGIAAYSMVTNAGWHNVVESSSTIRLDPDTIKMRSCIADRRLLIPTASGVKRVAAIYDDYFPKGSTTSVNYSTMYRAAGIPRALDPRCPNAVAASGTEPGMFAITGFEWLNSNSAVAYQVNWYKRDENGIPGIGAPSGRIIIRNVNTTSTAYACRLKIPIPAGVSDTSYVLQINRTTIVEADATGDIPDPGADMFLAGEYRVTSTDLANGYVLYEDVSFDRLLQTALYTNEAQEGALAARFQPPICRDIATFGGCAFFANTTERQRMILRVLAVDSSGVGTYKGVRIGDKIVMGDLVMEGVAPSSEESQTWYFAVDQTTGVGSEVIRTLKTTESIVYKYNLWSNAKNGRYYAYNLTTNNDVVGVIQLEEKSIGGSTGAYVGVSRVDSPVQLLPNPIFTSTPSNTLAQACAVSTDAGPTTVTVTAAAAHNLTTNDLIFLAPFALSTESGTSAPQLVNTDVPAGVYKITVTGATTFTFSAPSTAASSQTDARAATTGGYFHKIFDSATSVWTEARTNNNRKVNRLMWSAAFEPESAPVANYADLGDASKAILRIIPTQDSLFVFKEDGTWRLKGEGGDWEIIVLDSACMLAGKETPDVVDGRVFAYTTSGVCAIDDGGVAKVSDAVSGDLENLARALSQNPAQAQFFLGCGHGEQKAYWLTTVGYSQQIVYRYHTPTKTWSKHFFVMPGATTSSPGSIGSMITVKASRYTTVDNQAYAERLLVSSTSPSIKYMLIERRTGYVIDYCDREQSVTVSSVDTTANTMTLASSSGVEVGDVVLMYDGSGVDYVPGGYGFTPSGIPYRATISAVNGNVITLTISGAVPALSTWGNYGGSASYVVMKQIRATVAPAPIISEDGLTLLHFNEVDAAFGSCGRFSSCTVGFDNEVAPVTPGSFKATATIGGFAYADWLSFGNNMSDAILQYIRTGRAGVPRNVATGTYMIVSLRNSRAFENFDVAGIKILYSAGENKARRTNA